MERLPSIIFEGARISCHSLSIQIKWVPRISGSIASVVHPVLLASVNMILRYLQIAKMIWRFDHCCHKTGCNVILDVTMEEPDTRVVRSEAPNGVAMLVEHDCVPTNGSCGHVGRIRSWPLTCVGIGALKDLELVTVEMHWMEVFVAIIDD